ncbi:MAG: Nif11-like leader peptide family natural product precursor [Candidatus Eremiobacterota bacterium]
MSLKPARAFVDRMKTDEDFRKKVTDCKDAETRAAFVKEAGFDFTAEDIELVRAELSDDDIMAIAGGEKVCGVLPPYYFIEG